MIIIGWNGSGKLSSIFDGDVFMKILSIFITAAILKLAQGNITSIQSSSYIGALLMLCTYCSCRRYSTKLESKAKHVILCEAKIYSEGSFSCRMGCNSTNNLCI